MKPVVQRCLRARLRTAGLTIVLLGAAFPAHAENARIAATAAGIARAQVVRPITLTGIDDLDFGMVQSSGSGTVTVQPGNSLVVYDGGARAACARAQQCPQPHPARFEVSGERGRGYRISLPGNLRIAGSSGSGLVVASLTARSASRPAAGARGTFNLTGLDGFEVGGTLEISGALPPGHYRVSVPVIVSYD